MFKNLFAAFLLLFSAALVFGDPKSWHWEERGGTYAVQFIELCTQFRPFVVTVFVALAILLFMSKKQY